MTDKEAMKLALEALEQMKAKANFECWNLDICDEAITALKERFAQPEQEPVAWRTFDGEGLYFYCSYEDNETYADVWNKRNPNHKGWVEPLYKDPKPCPTCEALARTVMLDQTSHDTATPQRTWVGLELEQYVAINSSCTTVDQAIGSTERQLKENNK